MTEAPPRQAPQEPDLTPVTDDQPGMPPTQPSRPAAAMRGTRIRRPGVGRVVPLVGIFLGLAGAFGAGIGSPTWWAAPLALVFLTAGMVVSAASAVARTRWASAPPEAVLAMSLSLAPGSWIVPVTAAAIVVSQLTRGAPPRRVWTATTRGLAGSGLAAVVAVQAARLGDGSSVAAGAGMIVWWAATQGLSVLEVARMTGRPVRPLLRVRSLSTLPGVVLGAAVGLTFGWLAVHAPAGLLGLTAPLVLVISALQRDARQTAESRALAELVRTAGGSGSLDDAAQLVITSAARLLGGADVDLVVMGAGDLVRYSGQEQGTVTRTRVALTELDDPWISRTLSGRGGVSPEGTGAARRGLDDGRAVIAVPLGPSGSPIAALVARRPGTDASFSRDEALLADALAAQTAGWLPRAAMAIASGSADEPLAPPAIAALRTSAGRLAGLAVPEPDIDAVLDELRALEAAVAALFGAVSTAEVGTTDPAPGGDPGLTWTTSGVLP